ncbi:MAG: phage major capsid protein [Planctomycetota bacterium]
MSWEERKKYNEQRSQAAAEMESIINKAKAEDDRAFTDDENKQWDELRNRCSDLTAKIERYDALIEAQAAAGQGDPEQRSQQPGRQDVNGNTPGNGASLGVPEKDLRSYSILKVIKSQVEHRSLDGLERELSDEIARRANKSPEGIYVPHEIPLETRDLTTTSGSGAVGTVTTQTFIEMLRARTLVNTLGARVMGGLVGDLSIPKQTGGATAYWVDEGNAPAESEQTVGQVGLAPNTVGAFSDMSRKFIKQSSFDAESFVRADLAAVIARALDTAVFNGSGAGAEPLGVMQNADVATVEIDTNGGAPTFGKIVELETAVAAADADLGNLAYVTNAKGRGVLKTTPKETGEPVYLWRDDNTLNGYRAYATNLLPSDLTKGSGTALSPVLYGNWADVIIGMWGGLDLLVDPYTGGTAGNVRVIVHQDVDVALRHAESFAKIVDMATA